MSLAEFFYFSISYLFWEGMVMDIIDKNLSSDARVLFEDFFHYFTVLFQNKDPFFPIYRATITREPLY